MSIPAASARRPIAVSMLILAIVFVGLISLGRLPIDLLPDIAYPQLVVYTEEPGGAPSEVERSITEMIERSVAAVPGVQGIESVTREGVSLVTVRFAWGTDMDFAALNVRERLDDARSALPVTASTPIVLRTDPRAEPVLSISVAGTGDLLVLKELAEQVFKRRLEQLEGVANAAVTGGLEREIHVEIDPRLLESYGLTIEEVSSAIAAANAASQGGTIRQGRYRYALRTLGEFRTPEEIGSVVLRVGSGGAGAAAGAAGGAGGQGGAGRTSSLILLRDVATVRDGVREPESLARFSGITPDGTGESAGGEAVGLLVFKEAGANTVRVSEMVEATLDELRTEYPEVRLEIAMDQAGFISEAISNVLSALIVGGILAFLVLVLFLRDARYPVAISLAIPISVVATFALLDATGVSMNIMTLGGLALGVGMLVDNSIVVLENIFRRRSLGDSAFEAAVAGAEEVQGAITASTLTTISVFGPIIYVEGAAGELFGELSLAVAFSLLASLLVALTLLPVLAASWGREEARKGGVTGLAMRPMRAIGRGIAALFRRPLAAFDRWFARFSAGYHRLLEAALDRRGRVVAASVTLLFATVLLALSLPRAALPDVDQGAFRIRLTLDRGSPIERTAELAKRLESIVLADRDVEAVFTQIGRADALVGMDAGNAGLHTALLDVRLTPGATTAGAVDRIRTAVVAASATGLDPRTVTIETGGSTALGRLIGNAEADVIVRIGADDLDAALDYAAVVAERLGSVGGLANVRVGTELGQPEIRIHIDRERAASYGIDPRLVADVIERSMRGIEATRFADFDRRIPVLVRLPEEQRLDVSTLDELRVRDVPVSQLVVLERGLGPAEIHRRDQGRIVPVFADAAGVGLSRVIEDTEIALSEIPPPTGMRVVIGGGNEEMRRSFRDLAFAFALAMLLVYMILAAQFESLVHPFTILLSVPLGLTGAVAALAITGGGLNTMSLIGIVILVGVVVNDAIILVDLILRLRRRGDELRPAIMEAARSRLRPILMTTVTTVLGLLPMALGIGAGADLRAPLAVAVIGGLSTATLLTLFVIPVAFHLIESLRIRVFGESTQPPITIEAPRPMEPVESP